VRGKLTDEDARKIRAAVGSGKSTRREAANAFDVNLDTIGRIMRGEVHRTAAATMKEKAAEEWRDEAAASAERLKRMLQEGEL
jgi:hypothetical protein